MKKLFTLGFFFLFLITFAQEFVLVKFADKPSASTYLSNPTSMLTQKSIDRRTKYNIPITEQDVPVEQSYINQVVNLGIQPVAISKWFNGVFAELTSSQIAQVQNLPFVQGIESFVKQTSEPINPLVGNKHTVETFDYNYGVTNQQVKQLKLDYLHNLGFTGEGISIAVIDGGFPGVDQVEGFAYLRNNNQIKGGYNFVDNSDFFYTRDSHGTVVLSTIGGYLENQFVGTAIDADFYLYISEKVEEEIPHEEAWWIAAAERADYEGVDVINTSLGYSEFDDWRYNYSYEDMDGQTAFITRGAQIAAQKGIMLVNSAGNSGMNFWHYITAPADGKDVFTIGAVDEWGIPGGFSSYGPSSDGRVKPDVAARGVAAFLIRPNGDIHASNGTSFSSPIMAGAMACFLQAFPNKDLAELREAVRKSAHLYPQSDNQMGFGIPDFSKAHNLMMSVKENDKAQFVLYPNPTQNEIYISSDKLIQQIEVLNFEGKLLKKLNVKEKLSLNELPIGVYMIKVNFEDGSSTSKKIIKR